MDKRNSKRQMLEKIDHLTKKMDIVYDVGRDGIEYVGASNYQEREDEALNKLHRAMYGEDDYDLT